MLGTEPAEMQNFVQNDAALDECEGDECLFLLRPSSGESIHLVEAAVAARILLLDLFYLSYLMRLLVLIRLLHIIIAKQATLCFYTINATSRINRLSSLFA